MTLARAVFTRVFQVDVHRKRAGTGTRLWTLPNRIDVAAFMQPDRRGYFKSGPGGSEQRARSMVRHGLAIRWAMRCFGPAASGPPPAQRPGHKRMMILSGRNRSVFHEAPRGDEEKGIPSSALHAAEERLWHLDSVKLPCKGHMVDRGDPEMATPPPGGGIGQWTGRSLVGWVIVVHNPKLGKAPSTAAPRELCRRPLTRAADWGRVNEENIQGMIS